MERQNARGHMSGAVATAILFSLCAWMPHRAMAQVANQDLSGTTWRLTSLTMADTTVQPDDREKYTLSFDKNGMVVIRADCNSGRGRYMDPSGELAINKIVLTRMHCPPGSVADKFARALGFTESYTINDGNLLLGISSTGDTLRFERSSR